MRTLPRFSLRTRGLRRRLPILAAALALPFLAACGGDDGGPLEPESDLKAIATELAAAKADVLDDNPQLSSAVGLKGDIVGVSQTLPPSASLRATGDAGPTLASSAEGSLLVPRGVTCIWSLESDAYVGDPDDPGLAPANGIRFRLYELGPNLRPTSALEDIGLIDLVPLREGNTIDVTLGVRNAEDAERLSVALDGTATTDGINLFKQGTAASDDRTLNWEYGVEANPQGLVQSEDLEATLGDLAITLQGDVTGDQSVDLTVDVSGQGTTIRFLVTISGNTIQSGSVSIDGTAAGELSGSPSNVSVTGDLTAEERQDLATILETVMELELFALDMTNYALESLPSDSANQALRSGVERAL